MDIWYSKNYTVPLVRSNAKCIFVFGDNLVREGLGGQAIIRREPNTFGVPTKRRPNRLDHAYFMDKPEELRAVQASLRELWKIGQVKPLVFPFNGIGTGLAMTEERSPEIYAYICDVLKNHFGVVNGMGDDARLVENATW